MVGGVPDIVDAPVGLEALGRIERDRVVGMDVPAIVADVDGAVGRVAAKRRVDVEIGALVDGHAEEGVLGPLENDGGARDMAFPRLNAFSFWMTAFGALILHSSFCGDSGVLDGGNVPDAGWFAHAPLTSLMFLARPPVGFLDAGTVAFRGWQRRNSH